GDRSVPPGLCGGSVRAVDALAGEGARPVALACSATAVDGYWRKDARRVTPSELRPGLTQQLSRQVTDEMTAARLGSGGVDVLATPVMFGLMELASWQAVQ